MVFISVALKVLLFGLCAGVALAAAYFLLILLPLTIYVAPYCIWLGSQNLKGKYKDQKIEKIMRTAKNATKLYGAWIARREPTF